MDWNAVGAIGEVGGAVGVIVTLIYLAGQLRQNTNALKSSSYEHWNTQVGEFAQYLGQHAKELAKVRTFKNREELTPEQLTYVIGEFHLIMSQGECAFLKHRAGLLDDDVFEARIQAFADYFGEFNPVARQLWRELRGRGYTPDFVKFADEKFDVDASPGNSQIWEGLREGE